MYCRASLATSLLAAATFALSGISAVRRECPGGLRVYPVPSGFALGLYRLIPSYQLGLCPNPRPCGLLKSQNRGLHPLKPRNQGLRPRTPGGVYASLAGSLVLGGACCRRSAVPLWSIDVISRGYSLRRKAPSRFALTKKGCSLQPLLSLHFVEK